MAEARQPRAGGGLSDARLVARCRTGDQKAWDALVDRYAAYVHTIAVRQFRLSPADAEDIFQETFVRLYVTFDRLRDGVAVQAWLGRTARNLAIDRIRATRRSLPVDPLDATIVAGGDQFERVEHAMVVHRAIDDLGEPCREVLRRFFFADESYATISAALGAPVGTVSSRIHRCLERLEPFLSR